MKIVKKKEIPEIDKTYYQVEKIYCDECNKEIKEGEIYLSVNYTKEQYEELSYKEFCKDCMKDSMFNMFMNNHYTNFNKYIYRKEDEWFEEEEYDLERFNYKVKED